MNGTRSASHDFKSLTVSFTHSVTVNKKLKIFAKLGSNIIVSLILSSSNELFNCYLFCSLCLRFLEFFYINLIIIKGSFECIYIKGHSFLI